MTQACKKDNHSSAHPPIHLETTYYNGTWQCNIDGIPFSGTIDTSYTRIRYANYGNGFDKYDTIIFCTGTSFDKRAHIHFQLDFDRNAEGPNFHYGAIQGLVNFDTSSADVLQPYRYDLPNIDITIDSVTSKYFKARFSGKLESSNELGILTSHTVSNGIIRTGWAGSNHDPNHFAFISAGKKLLVDILTDSASGYFTSASLVSNTLVLDGMPISWSGWCRMRLQVRTGGTIKPGIYTSKNLETSFHFYTPSIYDYFIDDEMGDMTVTIAKVTGNIVYGSFSGKDKDGLPISSGNFAVRVKNYAPRVDSVNTWRLGVNAQVPGPLDEFHILSGNMSGAVFSNVNGQYRMTLTGETDNGASTLQIVVSSWSPITTGEYTLEYGSSVNFSSQVQYSIGKNISISGISTGDGTSTRIIIDTLDGHHVSVHLEGSVDVRTMNNSTSRKPLHGNRFSVTF